MRFARLWAPFFTQTSHSSANYYATIRGRAGVAFNRALLYVTGGVAAGGSRGPRLYRSQARIFGPWSQSSPMKYVLGAGFEYAFAKDWSARAEYLFLNQSLNTHLFDGGAGFAYASRVRNENHILRFGLNYHFGDENRIPGSIDYGKRQNGGNEGDKGGNGDAPERYSVHAQTTLVAQGYPRFRAQYDGANSFPSAARPMSARRRMPFSACGCGKAAPSISIPKSIRAMLGELGCSAAYVDSAVAKVGRAAPYMRFQRYFLRQIIGLSDGERSRDLMKVRIARCWSRRRTKSPASSIRIASS